MTLKRYDITKNGNAWELRGQGNDRATRTAPTKEQLMKEMREFMKGKEGTVRIHKADNTFEEERTYPRSRDPRRSPG